MTQKKTYITLLICTVCCIGFLSLLFAFTNKGPQRDTSFKRGFLHDAPKKIHELDLKYNSFYIAGAAEDKIYLGNTTVPLNLMILDTTLQSKQEVRLKIDQDSLPYQSPQLRVIPPHFFLMDGTIPYILRGNTTNWKAYSKLKKPYYFTNVQPIDSTSLAIRAISGKTNEFVLGTISLSDTINIMLSDKLLQKQVDGLFDTDGTLQYNQQLQQLIYTYRYRNQYIVTDKDLKLNFFGNTLDTVTQAQIQVGTISSKNQRKLSAPAITSNKYCATYGNYLFVNSKRLGRTESLILWEQASVIDVYNLVKRQYEFSFYVDDIKQNKLKTFQVLNDKFIGLIGNHIVTYKLDDRFKESQIYFDSKLTKSKNIQNISSNNKIITPKFR